MTSNVLEMPRRVDPEFRDRENFIRRFERQAIDSFDIPMSMEIRLIYQCLHRSLSPFNVEMDTQWQFPLHDQENLPYARFRLLIPDEHFVLAALDVKRISRDDYRRGIMTRPHHCPLLPMLEEFSKSPCPYAIEGSLFTQNFVLEWVRNAGFINKIRDLPGRIEVWGVYSLAERSIEFRLRLSCPDFH